MHALLGGAGGIAWWAWRRRHPVARSRPVHRAQLALTGLLLLLLLAGTGWRSVTDVSVSRFCPSPPGASAREDVVRPLDASLLAQKVLTWPVTGLGVAYADATGAVVCRYAAQDYYVAIHDVPVIEGRSMTLGDVVISPPAAVTGRDARLLGLHESHHRPQWAVATALVGPLGFPVAYGVDDFFFPFSRNHFERLAGLSSGGYVPDGTGPVLGAPQVAVLAAAALAGAVAVLRRRRRS